MEDYREEAAFSFYEQFVEIPEKSLMDDNSFEEMDYESEVEEDAIKLDADGHHGDDFDVEEDYDHYDDDGDDDDDKEYQDQERDPPCKTVPTFNKQMFGNLYNDLGQAMEDTIKSFGLSNHKWGNNVGVTRGKKQATSVASKTNTGGGGGRCDGYSFPFPHKCDKDQEPWNGATIAFQRSASTASSTVSSRSEDLTFHTDKQSIDHRQSRYTSFGNFIERAKQSMIKFEQTVSKLEQTMSKFDRNHSKRFADVGEACAGVDGDDDDDTATTAVITTTSTGVTSKGLQSIASSYNEDDDDDKADVSMTENNSLRPPPTNTGGVVLPIQSMSEEPSVLGRTKDMGEGLLLRTRSDPSLKTARSKTKVYRTRSYDGYDLIKLAVAIRRLKNSEAEKMVAAKKEKKRKKQIEKVVLGSLELDSYCLPSKSETMASGDGEDHGLQSREVGKGADIENILSDIKSGSIGLDNYCLSSNSKTMASGGGYDPGLQSNKVGKGASIENILSDIQTVSDTTAELQFRDRKRSAKHFEKLFYDAVEAEKEFHDGYIVTTFNDSMSVDHSDEDESPKHNKTFKNSCSQQSQTKTGKKKHVRFLPSPLPRRKKWSETSLSGKFDRSDSLVGGETGEKSESVSSTSDEKHNFSRIMPGESRRKKVVGTPRGNESTRAAMIQQHFFPGALKKKGNQLKRSISRGSKSISELVHSKVRLAKTPREPTPAECTISFDDDEGSQHEEDMFSDFSHLYQPAATIVSPEEECIEVSASTDQPQEKKSDLKTDLETETYETESMSSPFSSMMPTSVSDLISPKVTLVGSYGKRKGCQSKIRTVVAAVAFEVDLAETPDEAGLPIYCTKQDTENDLIHEICAGKGESECLPVKTKVFLDMQSTRASGIPMRQVSTIGPTGWKKLRQRTGNFFGRDVSKRAPSNILSKESSVTFEGSAFDNPRRSDSGCLVEHGVIESNSEDPGYEVTGTNSSMPFALSDSMKKLSMMQVISAMNEELRIMNERDSSQAV